MGELIREVGARVPWRVAVIFGAGLGLTFVAQGVLEMFAVPIPRAINGGLPGLAMIFAAALIGASRGREFDQGLSAAFMTIMIGFFVAIIVGPLSVIGASALTGSGSG